jgi:hypothetical protein
LTPAAALRTVRRLALALPEAEERLSHGSPAFFVRKKQFLHYWNNHHNDGMHTLWCAAPPGAQEMLVAAEPGLFFVPPYVGFRGWIGLNLDHAEGADDIAGAIENAYRTVTPPRLAGRSRAKRGGGGRTAARRD